MNNLGSFIITYRRPAQLADTLARLAAQTRPPALVLIVDNDNTPETRCILEQFHPLPTRYLGVPENSGPAGGAYLGLRTLLELGYEWIHWIDDDDPPSHEDTLERLMAIAAQDASGTAIGGLAEFGQRFNWTTGKIQRLSDNELVGPVAVDFIPGNGQFIVNAAAARCCGLPSPELFFSFEDLEMSLRLRRSGYRLLVDGERMKEARIKAGRFGVPVKTSSINRKKDSLWRNYYSTRGYIYMMRRIFFRNDLAWKQVARELAKCVLSFRHGPNFGFAFSRLSLLGVVHAYRGKMGRTIPPIAKEKTE